MSFNALRKTVGNFIAGSDTSSDKSSQSKPSGGASAATTGVYDEKNAPHSKLPVDTYYYPGTRYCYYLMDIEVTRVGHSGTMGYITGSSKQESDITKFYGEIYRHYAHGWMLNTFYEVPGIGKIGWSASSSPFQFVYIKPIANAPIAHTWDLKIGKCYIHTQLVTGIIGRQNHNVANTTGVTNMITQFAATGGRMIGIEFTGERQKQSGIALGKSDLMGVDLLFNVPKHPKPILYSYQCVNVPVRIMYLGTGKLVKVECDWMQHFARNLQQGWKLIDIFWDQSKKSHGDLSLSGDHNSIWFFEKESSKLKVNTPVWEGTIVEFKHTVKIGLGSTKPKSDWTPMFTEMGNRGWELACMLESPEITSVGLGTITYKVFFFFQRPIMQPAPGGYPSQAYPQAYPLGPQPNPNTPNAYPPRPNPPYNYPTQPGYPQAPPPYTQGPPAGQGASAYPYPQPSAPPPHGGVPARPAPPGSVPPGVPHKQ